MRISIFDNQHEAVRELPEERQGAFWVAFFAYVFDDVEPQFEEPMERMAWNLVKTYIEKSKIAVQNGKKGGRKPNPKTKGKNQSQNQAKNQNGNQNRKPALSENENENEREGLGESPKDSPNPSLAGAGAGGEDPAPRPGCAETFEREQAAFDAENPMMAKAARETAEHRSRVAEMEAAGVPCPPDAKAAVLANLRAALDAAKEVPNA